MFSPTRQKSKQSISYTTHLKNHTVKPLLTQTRNKQSLDSINMLIDTCYEIGAFVLYILAWASVAVIAVLSFLGFAAGVFTFMLHQSSFIDGEDREARWQSQRAPEASTKDSSGVSTGSDTTTYETFSDEPKPDTD
ncbi:hypothetical protein CDEST_05813 [Colletotrichum destructivum]|uniref:Copper transporter n=1 Tax=Colletotrichum destructivum TaxID=34406 RepID=A0AAX4ICV5_9PEZI|nr:hypothetical protein CDEST_05813 [Colletotrichum destructivum]